MNWLALALSFSISLVAPIAQAQAGTEDEAKQHFKNGAELYDENNFRGALVEFKRAYELSPSYKILFNIGQVEMELQDYAEALKAYTRYLREGGPDVPADRVAQLNGEIERLKGRVGTVAVQAAAGAEILVDDLSIGFAPLPEPATVNTGRHQVTVRVKGSEPQTRVVDIAGKQALTVAFDAPAGGGGGGKAATAADQGPHVTHPFPSKILMIGGGVALVAGATLGFYELSKVPAQCSVSSHQCLGAPGGPLYNTASSAVRSADIGFVIGGLGLAAVVGGAVWYFQGKTVEQSGSFAAAPWVTPEGAGIAFSGRL